MTPSVRAATLRSTALATSLALAIGLSGFAVDAWAKPKIPLPQPRPIVRNAAPASTVPTPANAAAANTAAVAPAPSPPAAPVLGPATRQHAALPSPRKQVTPAAVATTSSTSQSDKDVL